MGVAWVAEGGWGRERKPSWLFVLGVSALLHLPLLYLLGKGLAAHPWPSPAEALRVVLLPRVPAESEPSSPARGEEGGQPDKAAAKLADKARQGNEPAAESPPAAAPSAQFNSRQAVESALDMARNMGRETPRGAPGDPRRGPMPVPAANLRTPVATAGKRSPLDAPPPGETVYADGRMKVVDRWGRVSCVKEPADFVYGQHGEVIPRLAINTNCP